MSTLIQKLNGSACSEAVYVDEIDQNLVGKQPHILEIELCVVVNGYKNQCLDVNPAKNGPYLCRRIYCTTHRITGSSIGGSQHVEAP